MATQAQEQKEFYNHKFKTLASPRMEETIRRFYVGKMVSLLREQGVSHEPWNVLEAGVGSGMIMSRMQAFFPKWRFIGIDISEKNVREARQKGLDVRTMDAHHLEGLPLFDLIYGSAILHHLESFEPFLESVAANLKPGGRILFGPEPTRDEIFMILFCILRGHWGIEKGLLKITPGTMRRALSKQFKNIRIDRHGNPFVYCLRPLGQLWNLLRLDTLPVLNDIYLTAEKAR